MIGPFDLDATQQVRVDLVTCRRTAQVRFRIKSFDTQNTHQPLNALAVDFQRDCHKLGLVVQGVSRDEAIWSLAGLPESLPEGSYRLDFDADSLFGAGGATKLALGWALGSYGFTRYKKPKRGWARLVWPLVRVSRDIFSSASSEP